MNRRAAKVYRSTWKDVRGYFPGQKQAAAPTLSALRKLPGGGLLEADAQSGELRASRALVKSLGSRKPHRRKVAQYAVAHDLAHLFQDDEAQSTPNRVEGGAEAFARRVAKERYGLTRRDLAPQSYSGAVRRFRRQQGMPEAMKGQFR
jgi:hypothetical protein